jgi:tRNA uridine 5-carbamoylmethylation protein Kti12
MQNVFIGQDPLLSTGDYEQRLTQLRQMQAQLEAQKQQLMSPQRTSPTPIWDEIDRTTATMSVEQLSIIQASEEFQASQQAVADIINREYLKLMRPNVEATAEGRDALQAHLATIRRLSRQAAEQAEQHRRQWEDYTKNHADKTFNEYLNTKNKRKK